MSWLRKLPSFLTGPAVRSQARLHETPLDRFEVRVARTADEYRKAFSLVHTAYVYLGIENVRSDPMRIAPQHLLPEATVLVAYDGDNLVGTLTVFEDSQAGLPLDKDYQDEIDQLRAEGKKLVEYGSLAVLEPYHHSGVATLLFITAHWWSRHVVEASDCVIGVNPSAAWLYKAVFNFKRLGGSKKHAQLKAPVFGLCQDLACTEAFFARHYRKPLANGIPAGVAFANLDLPCVDVPRTMSKAALVRWKLPRHVFKELFVEANDRVSTLTPAAREHLDQWRSIETLAHVHAA